MLKTCISVLVAFTVVTGLSMGNAWGLYPGEELTPLLGGGGDQSGIQYRELRCGSGSAPGGWIPVGLKGRAGSIVTGPLGLVCRPTYPDGKKVPNSGHGVDMTGESNMASPEYNLMCPDDQVIMGIAGRSGWSIDNVSIICGRPGITSDGKITIQGSSISTVGPAGAGTGGQPFHVVCPNSKPADGVKVSFRPGSHEMNTLQLICSPPLHPEQYKPVSFDVSSSSSYPGYAFNVSVALSGPAGPNGRHIVFLLKSDNNANYQFEIPSFLTPWNPFTGSQTLPGFAISPGQKTGSVQIKAKTTASAGTKLIFSLQESDERGLPMTYPDKTVTVVTQPMMTPPSSPLKNKAVVPNPVRVK